MSFPTTAVLDSFKRTENPLSNGAQWKTFFPINATTGSCNGENWENANTGKVEGAYWSPLEFASPGVAITRDKRIDDAGYWSLWACISDPTTAKISGYRLKLKHTGGGGKFEVKLERCDENGFTVLSTTAAEVFEVGDRVGLSVQGGQVVYWRKKGAGEWEERHAVSDATYTTGFVGFAVEAADGNTTNFEAGGGGTSVNDPGTQHNGLGETVELQIEATDTTTYEASGLPEGLTIKVGTGKITGKPTKLESTMVTITVKGAGEDSVEFEWVIEELTTKRNATQMIVG
jgi:hypothetical protein